MQPGWWRLRWLAASSANPTALWACRQVRCTSSASLPKPLVIWFPETERDININTGDDPGKSHRPCGFQAGGIRGRPLEIEKEMKCAALESYRIQRLVPAKLSTSHPSGCSMASGYRWKTL